MGSWLAYAMMTIVCWGLYGVFLHNGAMGMEDPEFGRVKAFLFVGIAYFLTAVLAPAAQLYLNGADMTFPAGGAMWSLVAGIVGALGAFGVLLAFGAKGQPAVVMTLIFAGAPIVNALIAITKGNLWGELRWQFVVGIMLAIVGAGLVTRYKPAPHAPPSAPPVSAETR
jgi:drug/metabolite transporter (DMT)-like permease